MLVRACAVALLPFVLRAADPVLLFHLNESPGAQTVADAVGGHTGIVLPGAIFDGGRWGNGLLLAGQGGVRVADALDLSQENQLTLCAWIRVDDSTQDSWMRIISKKTTYDAHEGYELEYNPLRKVITLDAGDDRFLRSHAIDLTSGWHFVAATIDHDQGAIYADGVLVSDSTSIGHLHGGYGHRPTGIGDLYIGRNPAGYARFFGCIDEVAIYTSALSRSDIQRVMTSSYRTIGAWSFSEGSGAVAHDGSGLHQDGTIAAATWTTGYVGSGLAFAEPAVVTVPSTAALSATGQLTIVAGVKVADPTENAWMRIVSKKTLYTDAGGYELEYNPAVQTLGLIGGGAYVATAEHVALGTSWHTVVGIIDGRAGRLFLDGVEVSTTRVVGPLKASTTPFAIGRDGGSPFSFWHGSLDEIWLFNFAVIPANGALPFIGGATRSAVTTPRAPRGRG